MLQKRNRALNGLYSTGVEEIAKGLNYDFSGADKPANSNTMYGQRCAEFAVPLVKAVQELSKFFQHTVIDFIACYELPIIKPCAISQHLLNI